MTKGGRNVLNPNAVRPAPPIGSDGENLRTRQAMAASANVVAALEAVDRFRSNPPERPIPPTTVCQCGKKPGTCYCSLCDTLTPFAMALLMVELLAFAAMEAWFRR